MNAIGRNMLNAGWLARVRRAAVVAGCSGLALSSAFAGGIDGADDCCNAKSEAFAWEALAGVPGFDESTGRDLRNYPRDRIVDYQHMLLDVFVPDMEKPTAYVTQTLTLAPISETVSTLTLDARSMTIKSVAAQGYQTSFTYDGNKLAISFVPSLSPGEKVDVVTTYELNDPPRGLIWTLPDPQVPESTAQIHTQGQAETNSYWFPCHDFPNERLTTEVIATVPAGYLASSNGYLKEKARTVREAPGAKSPSGKLGPALLRPFDKFHWVQDREHVNYLVTLVIGKFDVVDVGDKALSCPVYVPVGRGGDVRHTYGNTITMIRAFEKLFDEPYPWARYAQLVVQNFEAGGMENTSATSMFDTAIYSKSADLDHDLDGLISHELGHQWWGDFLTCNSWEHIWLNEGFATYSTALWFEQRDGANGYAEQVISLLDRVSGADNGKAPQAQGFVSKVWTNPWEAFRRGANPYPKGAFTLHMLRKRLGDENFFKAIATYIDRHKNTTVETSDLRRVMEEVSGLQLEQFFKQWTTRPGIPNVNVKFSYDPSRSKLRFDIEQTQDIDADNPAFEFPLNIFVKNSAGPDVVIDPMVAGKTETFEVDLEGPPQFVAVNPELSTLARISVSQSPEQWMAQLASGPSLISKTMAIRALASEKDAAANEQLRKIASDKASPAFFRVEAVRSLARRNAKNDLSSLISTARDAWEVREATSAAIADIALREENKDDATLQDLAVRSLIQRATKDESLKVRNASMKGLARMKVPEGADIVVAALQTSSQSDGARQAALESLADFMPTPRDAMSLASFYAGPGFDNRTRGTACDAMVEIAKRSNDPKNTELALKRLGELLTVRENRVRMSAGEAIAKLGDPRGIELLEVAKSKFTSPDITQRFDVFLNQLRK
ncbi:MAG: M1 family aminopeptidase [Phycisphaerales bacterium]